ncbi:MAG: pilus assembly protein [Anaerolineales bacterium]|nr:MAG: pilus assembly protein [Anaerolineales bacterium]
MLYTTYEDGQGLAEYALLLMLIAIVLILIVAIFGGQVASLFSSVISAWPAM